MPYFLAESEAKQSDPRKEAAGAVARNAVEDVNGGHRRAELGGGRLNRLISRSGIEHFEEILHRTAGHYIADGMVAAVGGREPAIYLPSWRSTRGESWKPNADITERQRVETELKSSSSCEIGIPPCFNIHHP